jgi:hypothetical protein
MKKTYENGYLPKIAYHLAAGNGDKFLYFSDKQANTYGKITPKQMLWINDRKESILKEWAVEMKEMNDHLGRI